MPEKVTPEEVEKRELINEINRLNDELAVAKSRNTTLQSLVDKKENFDPAILLHYEGVILRQRMTLNNYTEVLWKRKQTIKMLRERIRLYEKRARKAKVVIPLDDAADTTEDHIAQAKSA